MHKKPFDLDAAKAGKPIVTRDGRQVKFVAHVPDAIPQNRLVTLVGKHLYIHFDDGRINGEEGRDSDSDLLMQSEETTVYVNFYEGGTARHFSTGESALHYANCAPENLASIAICVPVTLEL